MTDLSFWKGRRVLITGHTGFKGSWLSLWLREAGAKLTGYALDPPTQPSLFEVAQLAALIDSARGDIRDHKHLVEVMVAAKPEVVFHLAAQAIVRDSYRDPVDTYATNVVGTASLLNAVRQCPSVRAVLNVTTDKCYENREWVWGYRESDALGGYDPYSSSKACSEIVTSSMRSSFFNPGTYGKDHRVAVATARAGNVFGGGDWAMDRLVPDCVRALLRSEAIVVRNPAAIRPWQHVLEPLSGYLLLAQRLVEDGLAYGEAWNFGPATGSERSVEWMVRTLCALWGEGAGYESVESAAQPHEARTLRLDCSKARLRLGWNPEWPVERALGATAEWARAYARGAQMRGVCLAQIREFVSETQG